ncbi:MAG TPA: hypothetical protein VGQ57_09885 [Polyangiaceae bacterium]|jgi:hypothetical protein|nr:hypothetical protein [Polyangiaceae bacterium]
MREARLSFDAREPPAGELGVLERPPPGFGRGVIPAPGAAVVAVASALVLVTLTYYALRLRRVRPR